MDGLYGATLSPGGSYYNPSTTALYSVPTDETSQNLHIVTIVGWDDNYSASNFNSYQRPKNNGAYIAVNSWGTSFGNSGYFYISYDDYRVERFFSGITGAKLYNEAPNAEVSYTYSNGKMTAKITSDEKLSDVPGWTMSYDKYSLTKTYTADSQETVRLYDLNGVTYKDVYVAVKREVQGIKVKTQPSKFSYIEGQGLNLAGLVATLTYNDGLTEDVAFTNFSSKGISVNIANGTILNIANYNNKPVILTCNGITASTRNLTVIAKSVSQISIKTEPHKMNYIEKEQLNLYGLAITLRYNDNSTEDVAFENFANKGIVTNPVNGIILSIANHNNKPIVLTCNGKTANTSNLTISKLELSIKSSTYIIDNDNFITSILPNTNVTDLLGHITCNYEMKVYNKNNKEITGQSLIGTGMKIVADNQEYILVVKGDTDGSTKVDLNDVIKTLGHRAGGTNPKLTGAYLKAAELTTPGQVTLNDVIKIMRYKATNGKEQL